MELIGIILLLLLPHLSTCGSLTARSGSCSPSSKSLTASVIQCWKTNNLIQKNLLRKMDTLDCPATCTKINPSTTVGEYGFRMGDLLNRFRCLFFLQSTTLAAQGKDPSMLFVNPSLLSDVSLKVDEIINRPEVCQQAAPVPLHNCESYLGASANKLDDREWAYKMGYAISTELQSYLEKIYLSSTAVEFGKF